jgi:hypothetical protein
MRGFAVSLVLIAIGIVLAAIAGDSVALTAAGLAVAGVGAVIGVSAAFWIIGKSEDRDRDRGHG